MAKRLTTRLSAGAALLTGLGMMGIATAVPAQADITTQLDYTCKATILNDPFTDPWKVDLTIGVDENYDPGAEIAAPSITAEVTPGADAESTMRALGIKTLEGTATTTYFFGDEERTAEMTIPKVDVPAEGSVTTTATGTGSAETAPAEDGEVPVVAGGFTAALTTDTGFGLNIECTAPEDATVGTIAVGDVAPPAEDPADPPAEDPADPPAEDPADPPAEDPADPPAEDTGDADDAGEEPAVPDVVQTDGAQDTSLASPAALALGGVLLAGAGATTVVVARRRGRQH